MDDSKLDDRRISGKLAKLWDAAQAPKPNDSVGMMKARNSVIRANKNLPPRPEKQAEPVAPERKDEIRPLEEKDLSDFNN